MTSTLSSHALLSLARRPALPRWLPLLLVALAAIVLRHFEVANPDVSWLLTVVDKMLDGKRLYVDVIEVNPPATVYLYVLPAMLGRWSGLPAELWVDVLVFLAVGLSLLVSSRILLRAGLLQGRNGWELATVAAAALLILPGHTFGEREHVVLIAFLPLLALAVLRARGEQAALWLVIAAGIGGGIAAIIKPYFAVPIVCTAVTAAYFARSWRPIFALENWIAAGLLAVYTACVVIAFPHFMAEVLPLVLAVYVPAKIPLWRMLTDFATPLWLAAWLLVALIKRRALFTPPFGLLLAASFGFLVAFYVQQKGWSYQSYPMLALALIGFALAFIEHWRREPSGQPGERPQRMAVALAAGLTASLAFVWLNNAPAVPIAQLAQAIRAIKPRPKILALTTNLTTGFPLTRAVDGTWVGRSFALWVSRYVWYQRHSRTLDPQTAARLAAYAARDRVWFSEDLARGRPDILLVDRRQPSSWTAWIRSYPPLAEQMRAYRKVRTIGKFDILRREPDG